MKAVDELSSSSCLRIPCSNTTTSALAACNWTRTWIKDTARVEIYAQCCLPNLKVAQLARNNMDVLRKVFLKSLWRCLAKITFILVAG